MPFDASLSTAATVAGLGTLALSVACARLAPRWGLIRDGEQPRVGGLAVAGALALVVALVPDARVPEVLVPAGLALLLGLHDDLTDSPAWLRLLLLTGIAGVAWALGARIDAVTLGGDPIALVALSAPVTVGLLLVIVVGFDFIDGLDGLASSLGLLAAVGLVLLGAPMVLTVGLILALAAFVFGANRPPASAWLGDAGSNGLGMLLGALAISIPGPLPIVPVLLVFAIPILDAGLTVVRRLRSGGGLLDGELGHLHHRLVQLWGSPVPALVELLGVATLCTASALLFRTDGRARQALVGAGFGLVLLLWRTGWISAGRGGPGTR